MIDAVSFTNVIFLMAMFFTIAVNFTGSHGIVLELPHIEQSELYKLDSMVVTLTDKKIILFNKEVDIDKLQEELIRSNPQLLAIKAEKNISYSEIARIIALAHRIGIKQIAMAAADGGSKPR